MRMQASMALGLGTVRRWVPPRHSVAPNPSSPLHRPWTMALRCPPAVVVQPFQPLRILWMMSLYHRPAVVQGVSFLLPLP